MKPALVRAADAIMEDAIGPEPPIDRPAPVLVIEVTDPPAWLGSKWKPSHGGVQDIDAGIYWERNPEQPKVGSTDLTWQDVFLRPLSRRRQLVLAHILTLRTKDHHG